MPENQIPATQPEPGAAPGEFNFTKPAAENPRIRRRSLKAKPGGLLKPSGGTPPAARELEREAPPLSAEEPVKPRPPESAAVQVEPAVKSVETSVAPPRNTPAQPVRAATTPKTAANPASNPSASPHGTRPATLYYSSQPRKTESPAPMKTIPTAAASPTASSSTTTLPSSAARAATSSPRPATNVDYRANVERQSREQKSVGSILSYVVYAFIGLFLISAGLAIYGADVIFKQLHNQSMTVSDLDARYAAANKDLNAKLVAAQDTLAQVQAQIARQQDLIVKQQEDLNRLIAATNENAAALKQERQSRAQETAGLRARVRDLENRPAYPQKY